MGLTVFLLLTYSCVTSSSLAGAYVKSCNWVSSGQMFVKPGSCVVAGEDQLGRPVFSDMVENRVVEQYRCDPLSVRD